MMCGLVFFAGYSSKANVIRPYVSECQREIQACPFLFIYFQEFDFERLVHQRNYSRIQL